MEARGESTICAECYMPELWPENEPAVLAWLSIRTQWRRGDMGIRTGLDYVGAELDLRLGGHDVAAVWADLKAMEIETLSIDGAKRAAESRKGRIK